MNGGDGDRTYLFLNGFIQAYIFIQIVCKCSRRDPSPHSVPFRFEGIINFTLLHNFHIQVHQRPFYFGPCFIFTVKYNKLFRNVIIFFVIYSLLFFINLFNPDFTIILITLYTGFIIIDQIPAHYIIIKLNPAELPIRGNSGITKN